MKSVIVIGLVILHLSSCGSESIKQQESNLCNAEQNSVVSAVLRESLDPSNPRLPDYKIASQHSSVYVLDTVSEGKCIFNDNVLPNFVGASIKLVGEDQLDRLARENGGKLVYVRLSSIAIERNIARVWLGVSINYADSNEGPSLCCCGGEMILRTDDSTWSFDEWGIRVCA